MSFSFLAGRKQNKKNTNAFLRRTLRLEELESRQLLSVSWARVTDSAGYDNYLEASSTDTVWNCGTLSTFSDSMIVLQTEEQTAEIVLQGKTDDTAGPIVWKFNDESAGEYWSQTFGSVNANFFSESLVWTATGKTSPSRDFSITIWHDLNGDNLLNATESAKTLTVRIAWANVSVCTDQPEAGSTAPAVFSNYVTGSLLTAILNNNDINTCVSCDVGHSYWDFRGSNSLITGSSTLSSNLGNLINKSWGYSADTQSSPVEMLLNSGNIVAPGICHEETAPTSDAYATYWIDSMSDYVAMLTYTQDTIANPGNYVLLPDSNHATSHQCTDVVLGLLDAGGIELNLQRQTNVEVPIPANLVSDLKELFDYPVYGPGIRASYPWLYNFIVTENNTSFLYNGYSPANLGETLVANGGTRGQFSAVSGPATTETGDSVQQLPAPNFNTPTIGSKSVTMSWNNVANSSGYVLQWRLSTTGAIQGTKTLSGNTTTSCVVSGLLPATGYTFNVMATSSNPAYSNSNWSFNYLVTTNSAGYTPGDESAVAPVLYSDAVYSTAATFHWSAVSGAVSYVLQYYAKYPVKTDPVELSYSKAGTYTVSGLEKGTQYVFTLWGVKSDGSETTHSFPVYITTNSAGITLPIHIDSPLLQTVEPTGDSTISVSWSTVQDAAWYVLEYSTNSAFKTGTVVSQSFTDSNVPVTVAGLQAKTTYYFRVKAVPQNVGTTDSYWSQWLSTTTRALNQNETTIWVTSASDSNVLNGVTDGLTLREAIDQAKTQTNSVIGFADSLKGESINLVAPLDIVSGTLTINATNLWDAENDCPGITISGQNKVRGFTTGQSGNTPTVTLAGLTITKGNAEQGGGIFNSGTLYVLDCLICENIATQDGGGIYNGGALYVSDSRVSGNAAGANFAGGGMYLAGTLAQLDNVEISGNSQGGVLVSAVTGTTSFFQCTIAGNTNSGKAGGVYIVNGPSQLAFNNTILANNQITNPDEGMDSDIDCDTASAYTLNSCLVGIDPLFVAFNSYTVWNSNLWQSWNLALTGTSSAVDSGNSALVPLDMNVDLGNIPRIVGYSVDMGAHEYFLPIVASSGELSATQGCSLLLDATLYCSGLPGLAPGLTYAWDLNGDGVADRYGKQIWLSPPEVIWHGATFNVSLVVQYADNAASNPCVIRVDVQEIGSSVETIQTSPAESSPIAKYTIKASNPDREPVATWIIDWGDNTPYTTVKQVIRSLTVCHYYATSGNFTARVQMIDLNQNGKDVWYALGTTSIAATNQAVSAVDSFLSDVDLLEPLIPDEPEVRDKQEVDFGTVSEYITGEDLIDILALEQQKKDRSIFKNVE